MARASRPWVCLLLCCNLTASAAELPPGLASSPLAPPSRPSGSTLFTALPPEQTGVQVTNAYDDPRMWSDRYQEITYGAIGTGVAVGDYDNDGRPDLVIVSKTEGFRLFRNLGDWRFEDVTEPAGLAPASGWWNQGVAWIRQKLGRDANAAGAADPWHQGATFVDIDNDGHLDLYICRFDAPNLLFMNQGNGTFREEAAARGLAVRDASGMAAFADYDRDGWLDVYLQTNFLDATSQPNGRRDYLFRNNGDGTFTDVTVSAGISGETAGHSATWWDYDEDGWPDLYVANDFATPDRLYRNNGDGTFTDRINEAAPYTPYYAMGSDLGDVNNDGRIDFFVADMPGSTHQKEQRGMAGSRARAQENPETYPAAPQYMRNMLYLTTGTGLLLEAAGLAGLHATDWTWSVRLEDLDNDGRLDLHVTNGMNREYHNADLLERLMRAEDLAEPRRIMRASPVMAEANVAFRNRGDLDFENVSAAWGLNQRGVSFGAAFADFDGDGDLDLVHTNYEAAPTLLRNDSTTGHRLIVVLRGTRSNRFGLGATVRVRTRAGVQVRQLSSARGYMSSSEPILHFGLGEDERIAELTVQWPSGYTQTFDELAANQRLTITEPVSEGARAPLAAPPHPPTGARPPPPAFPLFTEISESAGLALDSREPANEDTLPQPLLPFRFNRRGPPVAAGDVDGDGRDELIVGGTTIDPLRVLHQQAGGRFAPRTIPALAAPPATNHGPLLLFDANGNGSLDLLVTHGGANLRAGAADYQPHLLLNDGRGGWQRVAADLLPAWPVSAGAAVAADIDGDGWADIFLGGRVEPGHYPTAPRSALWRNHGGRFEDITDAFAPGLRQVGMVTSALWSDVDGDGWPDLLLTLEWGGVRCWRNEGGRGLRDASDELGFAAAGTGWWTSLAGADFNRDGRPDFVAGNVGLNTPYQASNDRPALLYRGDFRGSGGTPQLIEAYYEGDRLYPRRIRRDLGAEIPAVLRRFPRNDIYARSTLEEILGADALAGAERFAATEFRHGVFLSQPDGTYRFNPLPRLAQIAPLQGIVAGDFDGDGHADIYAVQNNFAPIPMIGRFSGGLSQLLRGDGRGGFIVVPPAESGLVVPGDAKAIVVTDLDGDGHPDFVVTRNRDTLLAFRNNSERERAQAGALER